MSTDGVVPAAPAATAAATAPPSITADDKIPPGDEYEEIREQVSYRSIVCCLVVSLVC